MDNEKMDGDCCCFPFLILLYRTGKVKANWCSFPLLWNTITMVTRCCNCSQSNFQCPSPIFRCFNRQWSKFASAPAQAGAGFRWTLRSPPLNPSPVTPSASLSGLKARMSIFMSYWISRVRAFLRPRPCQTPTGRGGQCEAFSINAQNSSFRLESFHIHSPSPLLPKQL